MDRYAVISAAVDKIMKVMTTSPGHPQDHTEKANLAKIIGDVYTEGWDAGAEEAEYY